MKKKILTFLIIFLVVIALGTGGFLTWYIQPNQRIMRAIDKGDYQNAYEIYNSSEGLDNTKITKRINNKIQNIEEEFRLNNMEYAEANHRLDEIGLMKIDEIQTCIQETKQNIELLYESRINFATAQNFEELNDYKNAIVCYRNVIPDDINYSTAQTKLKVLETSYVKQIMNEVEAHRNNGEYEKAIEELEIALGIVPDNQDLLTLQNICTVEYKEICGQQVIADAQQKYSSGEYQEAFKLLEDYLKDGSEDKKAVDTYKDYIVQYANKLAEQRQYDEAISVVKRAAKYVPNDTTLSGLITDITNRKPVNIATLKIFNNGSWFNWNEKERADVFGNDYSNVANYVVVRGTQAKVNKGAEYYINKQYKSISGKVVPHSSIHDETEACIKIWSDDVVVYTSPTIGIKTQPFEFEANIEGAEYIKIEIETVKECPMTPPTIMLFDVFLNKE